MNIRWKIKNPALLCRERGRVEKSRAAPTRMRAARFPSSMYRALARSAYRRAHLD